MHAASFSAVGFFLLAASFAGVLFHEEGGGARILLSREGNDLVIVGTFANRSDDERELFYRLEVEKEGPAGRSVGKQSGPFRAAPREELWLSRMRLSVAPHDVYKIALSIMDGETMVASDSVVVPGVRQ